MKVRIFCGFSVIQEDAYRLFPGCEVVPPVERGGVAEAMQDRVNAVGLIDGQFHRSHAVSPTEIMDALRSGMRVYGSGSIGAIRAAELEPYGMTGVGRVFERVRSAEALRDDHFSQPIVEDARGVQSAHQVSYTSFAINAEHLVQARRVPADHGKRLCDQFSSIYFPERTRERLEEVIRHGPDADELLPSMRRILEEADPMRLDGLELLSAMRNDLDQVRARNEHVRSLQEPGQHPLFPVSTPE